MTERLTLVPSERHVEASRESTEISTLARFTDRVADEKRPASPALLREISRFTAEKHPLGERPLRPIDVTSLLHDTVAELGRGSVRPADLRRTGTARGAWLAGALEVWDDCLSATRRTDPRRRPSSDQVETFLARIGGGLVVDVEGHAAFDQGQLAFLGALHERLAPRGGGVRLRLPSIAGPIESLAEAIEREFAESPVAPDLDWHPVVGATTTSITECAGPEAEGREVAFQVLCALEQGASPERIAIVVAEDDDTFRDPLRAALSEASIPFSEARGPAVFSNPEARTLLDILDMADGLLDRDKLVLLLTTPGLHPGSLVREGDEVSAIARAASLAARVRALPVVRDRSGALFCEALLASQRELIDGEPWMVPALEAVVSVFTGLRGPHTTESLISMVLELTTRLRLGEPSARELMASLTEERERRSRLATLPLGAIGQGAVAVRAVKDALRARLEAAAMLGREKEPLGARDLADELRDVMRGFSTGSRGAASRLGAVRVGPLREMVGLDHDLLVFPRMTTSAFWVSRERSLLDDATRALLPASRRPRSVAERNLEQAGLLDWALHSGTRVALTFMSSGSDGRRAEPPHPAVAQRMKDVPVRREPASRLQRGARVLNARGADLIGLAEGRAAAPPIAARVEVERRRTEFFRNVKALPTRESGLVDVTLTPLAERFGGTDAGRTISVTAIDRAIACPFRAFAERVLRARKTDELTDVHGPRERGMLLHRALHRAFEDDRESGTHRSVPERVERCRAVVTRALAGEATTAVRRESVRRMVEEATLVFEFQIADEDTPWRYSQGERSFSGRSDAMFPPLEIRGSDGRAVFVEGQIDRFDEPVTLGGVKRALVVDYKTGKPSAKSIGLSHLQLPLYASVLRRNGFDSVSAVYVAIAAGGAASLVPPKDKDQAWDDDRLLEAETRAADAVLAIWGGAVPARPQSPSNCKRCDSRGLCRRPAISASFEDEP